LPTEGADDRLDINWDGADDGFVEAVIEIVASEGTCDLAGSTLDARRTLGAYRR
jgi:hypothetical protein